MVWVEGTIKGRSYLLADRIEGGHKSLIMNYSSYSSSNPMGASLVTQLVKNLLVMQETQVRSLGQEDPLEKGPPPTPSWA